MFHMPETIKLRYRPELIPTKDIVSAVTTLRLKSSTNCFADAVASVSMQRLTAIEERQINLIRDIWREHADGELPDLDVEAFFNKISC